jgi:hypothetical protein
LVRYALAAGSDFPGGTEASGVRDREAVVGDSDTENHTGSVGFVLGGHFVCASPDDERGGWRFPAGGLVAQERSDLLRRSGAGAKGAVGAVSDYFCGSPAGTETVKVLRAFVERLTDAVCYAA